MKVDGLDLLPQGVMIVWEWEWLPLSSSTSADQSSDSSEDHSARGSHHNPYMYSDTSTESDTESVSGMPSQTHVVTFKCIGTTHHIDAQEALRKASRLLQDGRQVPVELVPEPDNPYDSKAIAFKCTVEGNSVRIGYVVREALITAVYR